MTMQTRTPALQVFVHDFHELCMLTSLEGPLGNEKRYGSLMEFGKNTEK